MLRCCGSLILVLLAFAQWKHAAAQPVVEGLTQHTWRIEDGLQDQEILAIAQTADKSLWIGTPHGLIRFDGFRFHSDGALQNRTLQRFGVSSILAASDGSIWAGSHNGGIVRLANGQAHEYGLEDGLTMLSVRAIVQDAAGNIWAGTDHGIFERQGERFIGFPHLKAPSVAVIVPDGHGGLWFGGHRLIHYSEGKFSEVPIPVQRGGLRIRSIVPESNGSLLLGTNNGLLVYSPDGSIQPVPKSTWDIRTMLRDARGRLWIGTAGSGLILSGQGKGFTPIAQRDANASLVVLATFSSASGDLWIGTQTGLTRLSDTGMTLWSISGAVGTDYTSVFLDQDGSVWLNAGEVTRLQRGRQQLMRFPALGSFRVRAVMRDVQGALWVGSMGHGAYRFAHGAVVNHSSDLGMGYVRGFLQDADGSVWVATDSGVARWQNGRVETYQRAVGAPHQPVYSMASASGGGLWTGTANGLFLLQNGQYQPCAVCTQIGRQRVWSLYRDHEGHLWIGAESGAYLVVTDHIRRLRLPAPPASTGAVISILEDSQHRMLVAQPGTIYRFPLKELDMETGASAAGGESLNLKRPPEMFAVAYETGAEISGGLPSNGVTDTHGGAWYATHLGLVHLSPERSLAAVEPPPPVEIEQITVDGTAMSPELKSVTLKPSAHNLQVKTSPVWLSSRTGLRLRRRLFGLEEQWSDLEPGELTAYSNLPPGRYQFQAEARWPGDDRVTRTELDIVQLSPFWRRPWFLLLCALMVPFVAWAWHALRIRQLSLRFQAIAEERNRVAREMHDTLLQGCIGVSSLLEALALSDAGSGSQHLMLRGRTTLEYAREQVTKTIEDARAAISDLRRTEELKELGSELESLLHQQTERTGLHFKLDRIGPQLTLRPSVQHELFMAAREAVFNAVAHAEASHLQVELQTSSSQIAIEVVDDGKGFDPARQVQAAGHFGLVSMQERLHRIGGSIHITSQKGHGCSVRLMLPLQAGMVRKSVTEEVS